MEQINERPAAVVMFVDDAMAYGVENGYYPELSNTLYDNKELKVISLEKASRYNLSPSPQENDIFFYNPFFLNYIKLEDDMHMNFLQNKILCYQKVLGFMGAVRFKGEITKSQENLLQIDFKTKVGYTKANLGTRIKTEKTEEIKRKFKIERDFGKKTIKTENEIGKYLNKYGLGGDIILMNLFDEYKYQEQLSGSQSIEIALTSELNKSLDIALNLGIGNVFSLDSSFKKNQEERLEVYFKMDVEF